MGRSARQQREALDTYKRKMANAGAPNEKYMAKYERLKGEYQEQVWKEANAKKKEK